MFILKLMLWLFRLLSWPWAVLEREGWPAAPHDDCRYVNPPVFGRNRQLSGLVWTSRPTSDSRCRWPVTTGHLFHCV